jgi:hypothetical protein
MNVSLIYNPPETLNVKESVPDMKSGQGIGSTGKPVSLKLLVRIDVDVVVLQAAVHVLMHPSKHLFGKNWDSG